MIAPMNEIIRERVTATGFELTATQFVSEHKGGGVRSSDKMSPIYFVRLSKVWSILYHGLVGQVHKKMLFNSFIYFFGIFC